MSLTSPLEFLFESTVHLSFPSLCVCLSHSYRGLTTIIVCFSLLDCLYCCTWRFAWRLDGPPHVPTLQMWLPQTMGSAQSNISVTCLVRRWNWRVSNLREVMRYVFILKRHATTAGEVLCSAVTSLSMLLSFLCACVLRKLFSQVLQSCLR